MESDVYVLRIVYIVRLLVHPHPDFPTPSIITPSGDIGDIKPCGNLYSQSLSAALNTYYLATVDSNSSTALPSGVKMDDTFVNVWLDSEEHIDDSKKDFYKSWIHKGLYERL